MTFTPLTIPVPILSLSDATLAEKLVLALYHDNPEVIRPRLIRASGLTRPGLRKLMQRLRAKGWLSIYKVSFDGRSFIRGKVQVPGLLDTRPAIEDGYSVLENQSADLGQKVAPAHPVATTVADLSAIVIPAEILALKEVIASEKFVLSLYAARPAVHNAQVLAALGLSLAGLKKVKRRLMAAGLLIKTDAGYRVQVPGLVFIDGPVGEHYLPESEAIRTGQFVAPPVVRKVRTVEDVWNDWQSSLKKFFKDGISVGVVYAGITESFIQQMKEEALESPKREAILIRMQNRADYYTCLQYVRDFSPKRLQDRFINQLKLFETSHPDQLVALRQKVEDALVARNDPKELIEFSCNAPLLQDGKRRLRLMNAKVTPTAGGADVAPAGSQSPRPGSSAPSSP